MITEQHHPMPWQGIGEEVNGAMTAAEAIIEARLDWTVKKRPVEFEAADGFNYVMPGQFVLTREDTNTPLSIVGKNYAPLQNVKAFEFFDKVCADPGGPKYEAAGVITGGKRVWILAKLPESIVVTEQDVVGQFLLLTNMHSMQRQCEMLWTPIRFTCGNTLTRAIKAGSHKFRFKRVGNMFEKLSSAQAVLGIAKHNQNTLRESIDVMLKCEPTDEEVQQVLEDLIPSDDEGIRTSQAAKTCKDIEKLFREGPTNTMPGVKDTAWGLYNAITEFEDHYRKVASRSVPMADARLDSNWYGKSAKVKGDAFNIVMDLCISKGGL